MGRRRLAQEVEAVRPDAVIRGSDGYLRVNYNQIGAPFDTWQHWQATALARSRGVPR